MDDVTNEESLSFWGEDLEIENQPYNSLRRHQILEQLKNQFAINPLEWEYVHESMEGHWLPVKAGNIDRTEDYSGYIRNKETGEEISCWYDWTSHCEEIEGAYEICNHSSTGKCKIKFYINHLGNIWYDPNGNPTEEPYRTLRGRKFIEEQQKPENQIKFLTGLIKMFDKHKK